MSLATDVLVLLRDLKRLGLACDATYGSATVVAAIEDAGRPPEYDAGGEIVARTATATVARSQVAAPQKGQTLSVASGPWMASWLITSVGSTDDGSWQLELREDTLSAVRASGARRLAGGE